MEEYPLELDSRKAGGGSWTESKREDFLTVVRGILQQCRFLVVFIVTTHHEKSSDLDYMFDANILGHPRIKEIKCNPVSNTLMKKALTRIARAEGVNCSASLIQDLVDGSKGDLRGAIHALQFQALGEERMPVMPKGRTRKRKGRGKKAKPTEPKHSDSLVGVRDAKYSVFHSLGKILHAKEGVGPEAVVDRGQFDPVLFTEFLHHNFHSYLPGQDIESISEALDYMGDAELLAQASTAKYGNSSSAVPEMYSASVASRGFLAVKSKRQAELDLLPEDQKPKPDKTHKKNRFGKPQHKLRGFLGPLSGKVSRFRDARCRQLQCLFSSSPPPQFSCSSKPSSSSSSSSSSPSPSSSLEEDIDWDRMPLSAGSSFRGSDTSLHLDVLPFVPYCIATREHRNHLTQAHWNALRGLVVYPGKYDVCDTKRKCSTMPSVLSRGSIFATPVACDNVVTPEQAKWDDIDDS